MRYPTESFYAPKYIQVKIITELAKFSRADVRNLMASSPILDEAAQNPQPTGIQAS